MADRREVDAERLVGGDGGREGLSAWSGVKITPGRRHGSTAWMMPVAAILFTPATGIGLVGYLSGRNRR
ncbi:MULTISPECIES: hypothetical protein [unclassified Streptomyces]|uniref:hypothetical protein n=1 Tax=unclassified Streptomyces TaxID=2593676 RepID=UPI002034DE6E|nr:MULTISPECIES: hypothetical protein [unclassified Streptomyces]